MFLVVSATIGGVDQQLVRLGQYVMARRAAIGYRHRSDLAEELPLTDRTLAAIENGERKSGPGTYAIVETALSWQPGSIQAILAGREPTPIKGSPGEEVPRPLKDAHIDELLAEIRSRVTDDAQIEPLSWAQPLSNRQPGPPGKDVGVNGRENREQRKKFGS